jgi:hypothetical protein
MVDKFSSGDMVFDVVGVDQIKTTMSQMTPLMKKHIVKAINTTLINVDRLAKKKAPVGIASQLRAGIHPTFAKVGSKDPLGIVGSYAKHAAFMEFGTGSRGAKSYLSKKPSWYNYGSDVKMPPIDALVLWVMRKGLDKKFGLVNKSATSASRVGAIRAAAFLVARGIKRKGGLKARNYFYQAAELEHEPHMQRVEQAILNAIKEASVKPGIT